MILDLMLKAELAEAREALQERGWALIEQKEPSQDILTVATAFGNPITSPDRPLIQTLIARQAKMAPPRSMSGMFGLKKFPPHTDMAHWPVPARYIVFECILNEPQVPTVLVDSQLIFKRYECHLEWSRAAWKVTGVSTSFSCSALFQEAGIKGIRWDPCCMRPLGPLAEQLYPSIQQITHSALTTNGVSISWAKRGLFLIIDNWRILHARPSISDGAGRRVLRRVLLHSSTP